MGVGRQRIPFHRLLRRPAETVAKSFIFIEKRYNASKNVDSTQETPPVFARNPLTGVRLAKGVARERRVLTVQEQRRLETAVLNSSEPNAFGVLLTLYTGLRIGEVLGLMWTDLIAEKHVISVQRTVQRVRVKKRNPSSPKTKVVLEEPKTEASKRIIPIFDELWDMLMEFQSNQKLRKLLVGSAYEDRGLIFCNPVGGVMEPRTFEDLFNRLTKRAKIEDATFHTLRHTFATRSLETEWISALYPPYWVMHSLPPH